MHQRSIKRLAHIDDAVKRLRKCIERGQFRDASLSIGEGRHNSRVMSNE
jgi:hypothetical protein